MPRIESVVRTDAVYIKVSNKLKRTKKRFQKLAVCRLKGHTIMASEHSHKGGMTIYAMSCVDCSMIIEKIEGF